MVWQESSTRWGSRDAVLVGTRILAVVYALVALVDVLVLDGLDRVVLAGLAAATAVFFAVAARQVLWVADRTVDLLLASVALLPLLSALAHLVLVGHLAHSTVVLLVLTGIGAIANSRASARWLTATTLVSWAATVAVVRPEPMSQLPFYAVQLALASVLGLAILEIRLSAYRRLTRTIVRSDLQLQRFRSVFDHSPVGIGLADDNGLFVEANPALCELLGRPKSEVLGRSSREFTVVEDLSSHALAGRMIEEAASGVARVEKRYVRPNGDVRWAWVSFAHVPGPRGETWTVAHMQDVTERRLGEDELRLSRDSMAAAVEIASATQQGIDPRPVILHHLRGLAGASFVSLIEPLGRDRLVVTAVDGEVDLVGLSMGRNDPSVVTHVWHTSEAVFASELVEHAEVSPELLAHSGAASLMWQPVGVPGDLDAVLSIAWDDPLPGVDTAGRAAVEMIAAEAGAALVGERMRKDLEQSTVTDTLTGLLNRRGWDAEVARLRAHASRTGEPLTLVIVDLDHFKRYNDTFGHLAGDEALKEFAHRAQGVLRAVDVMARWGGEEFTLALQGTGAHEAVPAIERLRACAPAGLTCSVGYVEVTPADDLEHALAVADAALYEAKGSGRDTLVRGSLHAPVPATRSPR